MENEDGSSISMQTVNKLVLSSRGSTTGSSLVIAFEELTLEYRYKINKWVALGRGFYLDPAIKSRDDSIDLSPNIRVCRT